MGRKDMDALKISKKAWVPLIPSANSSAGNQLVAIENTTVEKLVDQGLSKEEAGEQLKDIAAELHIDGGLILMGLEREEAGRPGENWDHDGPNSSQYRTALDGAGISPTTAKRWQIMTWAAVRKYSAR